MYRQAIRPLMVATSKTQLVATKIMLPRCAPGLIARPRLLDRVAEVQAKQVTVIRAGPGFGKTSLAVAWAERLHRAGKSIAWLSLDGDDDEPMRFLFYLAHSLRRANERVAETAISFIADISLVPFDTIVSSIINDLAEMDDDVYLFLDDYHHIKDHEIRGAIAYLLRYAPTQFHLVVTAIGEPALPLPRLRAHNQLLEIDTAALRFNVTEMGQFLKEENVGGVDPADVRLLHAKTDGWPAVLRIVMTTAARPGQDFGRYIQTLSGAMRPLDAYLADMLVGLPYDLVQFMLQIAILERFSAPLCEAVTGCKFSRQRLDALETGQILLVGLDQEREWYRFHTLLGTYLLKRLEAEAGPDIARLHRRAYRWYASRELWTDAVRHAIAAGDAEQAMLWIENCAMELVKQGDLLTLLGWQRLFPAELTRTPIKVGLAVAWGLALAMRFDEAREFIAKVEHDVGGCDRRDAAIIAGECMAIRAVVMGLGDDSEGALALAQQCIDKSADTWTANVASNVVRFGHWKAGDLPGFHTAPWIPSAEDDDKRILFASVYRLCFHGLVEFQQLRLGPAEHALLEAMRLAERHVGLNSCSAALPASLLARIRYEQGRMDEAEALITDRSPMIDATGMHECVISAYVVLAQIALRRRNIDRAYALLDQLENLGHMRSWGRVVAASLAWRTRVHVTEGRLIEAGACLSRLERLAADNPTSARCAWSAIGEYSLLTRAIWDSAHNRPEKAAAILQPLLDAAKSGHDHFRALRLATQLAITLLAADRTEEAHHVFHGVLAAAAPSGFFQTLLDEGPEIGILLFRAQEQAQHGGMGAELRPYIANLVAGWQELYQPDPATVVPSNIADALSPREKNILEHIGRGRSNKEIARELGIAPETVKSHIKNIFTKLAVERRAQAVGRAQSLGLVSTP
jgi:LuxR family transcriptional regulator, maltose regulon positive regulatory protein